MTTKVSVPAKPVIPPTLGAFDAYASLIRGGAGGADAETRPIQKGEFATLIGKLSAAKRAELQKTVAVFRELAQELPKIPGVDADAVKAHSDFEIEKAAKSILVALRRDQVDDKLTESIKLQLYNAYLLASEFEKAIALYPRLKSLVGGRMKGIYGLSAKLRETFLKHQLLSDYFAKTPNAKDGLLGILTDASMTTDTPNPQVMVPLYHFGSRLPIMYLLAACLDIASGLCGNCNSTSEERLRLIIGGSFTGIKPGLFGRTCEFAGSYA